MPFDSLPNADTFWIMPTNDKIAEVLEDQFLTRGWSQGMIEDEYGHVCMLGAIGYTLQELNPPPTHKVTVNIAIEDLVAKHIGTSRHLIPRWNDSPSRRRTHLFSLLRKIREDKDHIDITIG